MGPWRPACPTAAVVAVAAAAAVVQGAVPSAPGHDPVHLNQYNIMHTFQRGGGGGDCDAQRNRSVF